MFASACTNAKQYTFPIVISSKQVNGVCSTGIGTFVIINEDGYLVTAWHIVEGIKSMSQAVKEYEDLIAKRATIENDPNIKKHEKIRILKDLKVRDDMITNFSVWFGKDGIRVTQWAGIPEADFAVGKIENFDPKSVAVYPSFKDPKGDMVEGTSLCKLGFPFHNIIPTYEDGKGFILPPGSIPIPFFPLEGIFTRDILIQPVGTKQYPLKFVETSSPGLRGQSGGPTFDVHGNIWAIQSSTRHLKLGFGSTSNHLKQKEKEILENQYLHVGWGTHSQTITGFLTENKIKFNVSL